ncbi:MAG TPA: TfoX/Sxy family protein [Planctomycetota bacterium]|jgi:DNA transformation protein|nr:TfoX/Sxy family protein [Planctomycetota bacterium]
MTKKKRDSFRDYVLEQLGKEATCRAMFGGHGLYHGDRIFGIVYQGRLYFTTSPLTRPDFVKRGMKPFKPNARQTLRSYYEVPVDVLENAEMLRAWALRASS